MHKSVLLDEVVDNLNPVYINNNLDHKLTYLDLTFGFGGHTKKILSTYNNVNIIACDRDRDISNIANKLHNKFGNRFHFINDKFSNIDFHLEKMNIKKIDAILLDLGVSSMQLDNNKRGFSFNSDDRLDMRMDQKITIDAEYIVNNFTEIDLANIIYTYGEERNSRAIARNIVQYRKSNKIITCSQLRDIINSSFVIKNKSQSLTKKINHATKSFQAIRIFVNKELAELEIILSKSVKLLNKNGRILIISFHSLEDKIVKEFFKKYSDYKGGDFNKNKFIPDDKNLSNHKDIYFKYKNKTIKANIEELRDNIRSRSARMRMAIRV